MQSALQDQRQAAPYHPACVDLLGLYGTVLQVRGMRAILIEDISSKRMRLRIPQGMRRLRCAP